MFSIIAFLRKPSIVMIHFFKTNLWFGCLYFASMSRVGCNFLFQLFLFFYSKPSFSFSIYLIFTHQFIHYNKNCQGCIFLKINLYNPLVLIFPPMSILTFYPKMQALFRFLHDLTITYKICEYKIYIYILHIHTFMYSNKLIWGDFLNKN